MRAFGVQAFNAGAAGTVDRIILVDEQSGIVSQQL
jgi:hypothetical protein